MPLFNYDKIQDFTSQLSLEKIFGGDFSGVLALLYLALSIAIYSILIYNFYRYIARRDCFKPFSKKHSKLVGLIKYCILFPFIAIIFFLGFSLMLLFLAKEINIDIVLSTSFAIVLAIRITSYYTEDLSRDVAKMLPFALLGVFLVSPSYFEFSDIIMKINSLPEFISLSIQFIFFIIIIEWVLRLILVIRRRIFIKKQNL
jgi:hypothetical protein